MKKNVFFLLMKRWLLSVIFFISSNVFAVLTGNGTEESPYLIQSRADFNEYANSANAAIYWSGGVYAKLMCDLDLAGTTYKQAVIGPSDSISYIGNFNGNGNIISNLTINMSSGTMYGGLFGFVNGGNIINLGLDNVNIYCPSTAYVGGLVGRMYNARISFCYTTGSVKGDQRVGGLAGQSGGGSGLINCYSTASANGSYIVGGLVGWVSGSPRFCYSTGPVVGSTYVGGLMGYGYQGITRAESCFWDIQTSGISRGTGYGSSEQIFGKTTAEMKTLETFTDAGWDFSLVPNWKIGTQINNGYPFLAWQDPDLIELTILSPNGGEIYPVGTTKTITWEKKGEIANVQLSYSTDNGSTWTTIKTVANTGSTTWTIPNTPSAECLLKISDADSPDIFDISDAPFTIQPAYPVVTSPNGGEQLYTSTERTIYWNTVGAISSILIEYSTDNGLNWIPVEPANVGNTKSYKWKVPHTVSEQCLIRVSDADNPSSFDVSNFPFSIIASIPELIIPNDGENLLTGSVADIRWLTRGVIENITIDYSIDNGSSWQPVSPANSGNTGHYQWTVPHQISDQCLVRISNADHPEIFDISENTFQIVASLPSLVSPNGGEQLLSGTIIPIQWNTTGSISDILIEYSVDNGTTWIAVTPPNTGNTGSYDWTVPYVMSKECLIRVSDASHPVVNDVSDAAFEISSLYLTVPNGREKMVFNSQYTIRWNSGEALSGDSIHLQYSTNKGLSWADIVSTENDGLYEWAVPGIESNQYLIQIRNVNNPEIQDISENAFMVYQCHEQIASDLDGNCTVDLSDFAIMAQEWLHEGVILSRIYALDETPNWTTEGQWEFGQPLGLGGASYGNPDPNSGHTGLNVYGINLSGDYNPAISGPYYLTTSVIDCTQYDNVKVSFMSWLNIDDSNYAQCSFEVSADGAEWISLWCNTPEPVTENGWNKMEFDISEYADDNPILYLRWGYQIIDRAYPYSGWNIDDVELWGTLQGLEG